MSLSNLIIFSFFNIESDEEEIVLIAAAIHLLKKKKITVSIGKTLATYDAVSEDCRYSA